MNEQLLRNFINLVTFDQELQGLEKEAKSAEETRHNLQEQKQTLINILNEEKTALSTFRKEVDAHELAMKELDERESGKKKRLETVSSSKEYSALKAEIEHIHDEQRVLEIQIIDAWDLLDAAQKKLTVNEESNKAKIASIEESVALLDQKLSSLQREIAEKVVQRKTLETLVPEDLVRNYQQMRGRVANPVVPVEFDSCSACFYSIPVQDLAVLRSGAFLPCRSCYRILYLPEPTDEQR